MLEKTNTINPAKKIADLRQLDFFPDIAMVRLPAVQALLGVSKGTVYRMIKSGRLKAYRLTERTTVFNMKEIRALLDSHKKGGTANAD